MHNYFVKCTCLIWKRVFLFFVMKCAKWSFKRQYFKTPLQFFQKFFASKVVFVASWSCLKFDMCTFKIFCARYCSIARQKILYLKVRQFQDEFMKSSFLPKYEHKIVKISALTTQGRNPNNFLFIFWEER